jgi:hypothetical protein
VLLLTLVWNFTAYADTTTLVPVNANWKGRQSKAAQGTAWTLPGFYDGNWRTYNGQTSPDTSLNVSASQTTFLRTTFSVQNKAVYQALILRLQRSQNVIVYLNGTEIYRSPPPIVDVEPGEIEVLTDTNEDHGYARAYPDPDLLRNGNNVLAVQFRRQPDSGLNLPIHLLLTASTTPVVTRGPYLQRQTPNAIVFRWRTNVATDSRVRFGTSSSSLSLSASSTSKVADHAVAVSGLSAKTRYYYSVGSTTTTLAGGGSSYFFYTAPPSGTVIAVRIWVVGDSGTGNSSARAVRNAFDSYNGSKYTNMMLMLGDNAYSSGTDSQYQSNLFDVYKNRLRQTVVWPTIGNHDTAESSNPSLSIPYFLNFTLPTKGEAGGLSSGTEKYYSFNYSNIHFVCLDSMTSSRSPGGAMLTWLKNDLANNTKEWVIAYWHHPPYTKGSHDSDVETRSIEMRKNALPILENYGVDLVLAGHSHSYERSKLIDGFYGFSKDWTKKYLINGGSGRTDGGGAYTKPAHIAHKGAVYAVAGSSGHTSSGPLNHPVMYISLQNLGSMILDINGKRMDVKFLRETGSIGDYFTIIHN